MNPQIDVLMCSYNEAPYIPAALESLRLQSAGTGSFRLIFVDNASSDDTRRVVEENSHGLNLEYVYETNPGLNFARNAGYHHARAPYVAHLDADAKADERWIENILNVVREMEPDLCGGPYFPYYTSEKPRWFLDKYNSSYAGASPRDLRPDEFLSGTNMIWRRSLVEELGGFNSQVGLMARGLARGDEINLIQRARRAKPGFRVFYHPQIIVYHLTRPDTFSLWYWIRRAFSQGTHHHLVVGKQTSQRSRALRLAQFSRAALRVGARGAKAMILRDKSKYPYWENYVYEQSLSEIHNLGEIWSLVRAPGES